MSITQTMESSMLHRVIDERDELLARLQRGTDGVSVVIPCYEQAEWLWESLGSVIRQTVPPVEVLIIDDGSQKDDVAHAAQEVVNSSALFIPVAVIRVANRGLPSARNVGLMNAAGKAFLPLDADDWLEPTYIEKTLPLLERADVVVTGLQEHGERTGTYKPGCELGLQYLTVQTQRTSNRLFYCALFRTELLRQVGGYNGRMINGYEDWDLWIDLYQRGVRIAGVDEPLFNYRTRKDGMLAQTEAKWRDWNFDEMARHHGYERPQRTRVEERAEARQRQREARLQEQKARRERSAASRQQRLNP